MNNCNEIKDLLSFYLEGQLHENERKQVVSHLESCVDCKKELEQLSILLEGIKDVEQLELPEDFNQKLHDKLINTDQGEHKRFYTFTWASGLVACFLLLIFSINGGYFNLFNQPLTTAYVNDKKLEIVDNTQIVGNSEKDTISVMKNTDNSQAKAKINRKDVVKNDLKQDVIEPQPENNIPNMPQASMSQPQQEKQIQYPNEISVLADNTPENFSKIKDIIYNNGGKIEEFMAMKSLSLQAESNNNTEKTFQIQIPKASYENVLNSLKSIGITEESSISVLMDEDKSIVNNETSESKQDDNLNINLIIRQK